MAYQSLLGYAKDGIAEVVGRSSRTMSDIDTWALDAYRNLKFYSPATGELKTWLEANAVRLPLTGTWVFNETLTAANPPLRTDIAFTSNGTEFTNINTGEGGNVGEPTKSYPLFYNDTKVNSDSAYTGKWVNSAYRAITFTQPVQYQGNEEFVRWFVDNAVPVEKGINYLLNDSIRGTTSYTANVSRYDFKKTQLSPLFQNVSFKYKGKEFTEIYCSGYLHRSQLSTGSGSKKRYMNSSTLHINLSFTNGDYTVGIASNNATNRTAWQSSSSSYPSYPTGLDLNTKDIILSFDTAPTGSFLTWLNEHATLIPTTK